jgi:DNA-directed RNA polymerase subunit RPC12/RpoP
MSGRAAVGPALAAAILILLALPAHAAPVFFTWGGETIVKAVELPDTPDFQRPDGAYIDIGYRYQQVTFFFIPLWNYNEKLCGYIGSDSEYLDGDEAEISALAAEAQVQLPAGITLPFWDSVGGKLLVAAIVLLYIAVKRRDSEPAGGSVVTRSPAVWARRAPEPPPKPVMADIHFTCENCGKRLAMDRRGISSQVQCPDCGFRLTVPEAAAGVVCAGCGQMVLAAQALVGEEVECQNCRTSVRIDAAQAAPAPKSPWFRFGLRGKQAPSPAARPGVFQVTAMLPEKLGDMLLLCGVEAADERAAKREVDSWGFRVRAVAAMGTSKQASEVERVMGLRLRERERCIKHCPKAWTCE